MDTASSSVVGTALSAAAMTAVPLVLSGQMNLFWDFLDIVQIDSLLMYVNANYPANVEIFFKRLQVSQLTFLPNVF
jgi:hypothetical protein